MRAAPERDSSPQVKPKKHESACRLSSRHASHHRTRLVRSGEVSRLRASDRQGRTAPGGAPSQSLRRQGRDDPVVPPGLRRVQTARADASSDGGKRGGDRGMVGGRGSQGHRASPSSARRRGRTLAQRARRVSRLSREDREAELEDPARLLRGQDNLRPGPLQFVQKILRLVHSSGQLLGHLVSLNGPYDQFTFCAPKELSHPLEGCQHLAHFLSGEIQVSVGRPRPIGRWTRRIKSRHGSATRNQFLPSPPVYSPPTPFYRMATCYLLFTTYCELLQF